ncbi:MAG: class I SAM-dependent methyltransferase [Candidatus Nanopelagicales bacterium]
MSDRKIERERYEGFARRLKEEPTAAPADVFDTDSEYLLPPYRRFAEQATTAIRRESSVLEIGAGTGALTGILTKLSDGVVSLDISDTSLAVMRTRTAGQVEGVCGDMAALPLRARSFDVVTSAGSLSYADPAAVDKEICRVLKPGGSLLIVDSLNHNPIYRANRWVNYRRGRRTRSTIVRMPTSARIKGLTQHFETSSVEYYGSFDFAYPVLTRIVGADRATSLVVRNGSHGPRSAFKFVLLAQGFRAR